MTTLAFDDTGSPELVICYVFAAGTCLLIIWCLHYEHQVRSEISENGGSDGDGDGGGGFPTPRGTPSLMARAESITIDIEPPRDGNDFGGRQLEGSRISEEAGD